MLLGSGGEVGHTVSGKVQAAPLCLPSLWPLQCCRAATEVLREVSGFWD